VKRKRFSVERIVAVLKRAGLGMAVTDLTRQVGISEQTFYRWKKQYAGMQSDQVRELKQLQEEIARLKKLVAVAVDHQQVAGRHLQYDWSFHAATIVGSAAARYFACGLDLSQQD
jgi:putative transposase